MSLGYLARRGPWSLQCLMSLSDGGWSRELRKSSPSCLLLPVQPLLVGLVEWGRRFEKNTLMGQYLSASLPPSLAAGVLFSLCNSFLQNHLQPLLFLFINLNFSLHTPGILGGCWRKEGSKVQFFLQQFLSDSIILLCMDICLFEGLE